MLDEGDTKSIKTCYGELDFTDRAEYDMSPRGGDDVIVIEDDSAFSTTDQLIKAYIGQTGSLSDFIFIPVSSNNSSSSCNSRINASDSHFMIRRYSEGGGHIYCSSGDTQCPSEYLDIITLDSSNSSSNSTRVDLTVPTVHVPVHVPVVSETDSLHSDTCNECCSCGDGRCQFVGLQDNNRNTFHTYENMVEMVQL